MGAQSAVALPNYLKRVSMTWTPAVSLWPRDSCRHAQHMAPNAGPATQRARTDPAAVPCSHARFPLSWLVSTLPGYIWLQLLQQGCRLGQQGRLVGVSCHVLHSHQATPIVVCIP